MSHKHKHKVEVNRNHTTTMKFKPVTHVIFDMDGLILNTEGIYKVGYQTIASRYGKEVSFALKCKVMGMQIRDIACVIVQELQLPLTADEFLLEIDVVFRELFPRASVLPGVETLIHHLRKHHVPIALATSSSRENYELKTVHHYELFSLFHSKTWGPSDPKVRKGKPEPDIFLVAAAKFPDRPKPEMCLVFEDSVNGVRAARAAGMQVVMVPDSRVPSSLTNEATLVLSSISLFRPEDFGLPPFDA